MYEDSRKLTHATKHAARISLVAPCCPRYFDTMVAPSEKPIAYNGALGYFSRMNNNAERRSSAEPADICGVLSGTLPQPLELTRTLRKPRAPSKRDPEVTDSRARM